MEMVVGIMSIAEDGAHEVRWTSALRRPERSRDLEPWVQGTLRSYIKKGLSLLA